MVAGAAAVIQVTVTRRRRAQTAAMATATTGVCIKMTARSLTTASRVTSASLPKSFACLFNAYTSA